jgi:hypothetical protein
MAFRLVVEFQPLCEFSQAVTWLVVSMPTPIFPYCVTKDWMNRR